MTDSHHPLSASAQPSHAHAQGSAEPKMLSIISLVLGLASIFLGISILVPIAGIIVGAMARKREPSGRTMALWGIWLSIATLVLGALLWILAGGFILATLGLVAATGG